MQAVNPNRPPRQPLTPLSETSPIAPGQDQSAPPAASLPADELASIPALAQPPKTDTVQFGSKTPDNDGVDRLPAPLKSIFNKAINKAAETGSREVTPEHLVWAMIDTYDRLINDTLTHQEDRDGSRLSQLNDLAGALAADHENISLVELRNLLVPGAKKLEAQFSASKKQPVPRQEVALSASVSQATEALLKQPATSQNAEQLVALLKSANASAPTTEKSTDTPNTPTPASSGEGVAKSSAQAELIRTLETRSPDLAKWYWDMLQRSNLYANNDSQIGDVPNIAIQTLALARESMYANQPLASQALNALIPGGKLKNPDPNQINPAINKALRALQEIPGTDSPETTLAASEQTQKLLRDFLNAAGKRGDTSLGAFIQYLHKQAEEPQASDDLKKTSAILKQFAVDAINPPLLSQQEAQSFINKSDASSLVGAYLREGAQIARMANASQVEPEHYLLAMLRDVETLIEYMPEYISADPDTIPDQVQLPTGQKISPLRIRMTLDALLPPELRKDLTQNQVVSMMQKSTTAISELVYRNGRNIKSQRNTFQGGLPLSQPLLRGVTRLAQLGKLEGEGTYLYEFSRILREVLPLEADSKDQKLGEVLNHVTNEARKKSANIPNVTFDDVGGYKETKKDLKLFSDLNKDPGLVSDFGIESKEVGRGLVLHGPPGNGKTYMAKAMANYLGLPFFSFSGPEFFNKYVGESEANVRKMFADARKHEKAVIFIDEADGLLSKRQPGNGSGADDVRNNVVNTFLAEMDGFLELPGVIVIAATNRLDDMDPAAIRPGRLGKHIEVPQPNKDDRKSILGIWTRKKPLADDVDLDRIAGLTNGSSSVELKEMAVGAGLEAFKEYNDGTLKDRKIHLRHFDEARDTYLFGPKNQRMADDFSRRTVAHHEILGHGLLGYALDMELRTLTTIGRQKSAGHVEFFPGEGFKQDTTENYLYQLLMTLGGRAAEEKANGREKVTGGARSDYDQARAMLVGMISQGIIPGHAANNYQHRFDGRLDKEDAQLVSVLLDYAWATAVKMIEQVDASKRERMADILTTGEGVQLRNKDAMGFFQQNITPEETAKIKAIADEFVQTVIRTVDRRSGNAVNEFFKLAQTQEDKQSGKKQSGDKPITFSGQTSASKRLSLVG